MPPVRTHHREPITLLWAVLALVGFAAATVTVLGLDLASPLPINRHTISAYVFTDPVVFTAAVISLAAGSAALIVALYRRRVLSVASGILLSLWTLGILASGLFPKHNWVEGPSLSGHIHRVASLVAFFALPLATVLLVSRFVKRGHRVVAWLAAALALGALSVLGYLVWSVFYAEATGVAWWMFVDLGLVERILIAFEVATLAALAVWAALSRQAKPGPHWDQASHQLAG